MKPYLLFLLMPLVASLLSACGPSAEEREARRQRECLNKICPGDVQPVIDFKTEFLLKRNGRWFVAPKAYGASDGAFAFYWPSKTPMTGRPDRASYPERGQDFSKVAIEFFVEAGDQKGEMYPSVLKTQEQRGNIASREQLRSGFEQVMTKSDGIGSWNLYIAYDTKTPSGVPALLSCRIASDPFCSTYFTWKNLSIYVRFDYRHAQAWPEIFAEILHVLNQVKEIST